MIAVGGSNDPPLRRYKNIRIALIGSEELKRLLPIVPQAHTRLAQDLELV